MKTDDLISVLAADLRPPMRLGPGLAAGLAIGGLAAAGALALIIGVRPDLLSASSDPLVAIKPLLPALLAVPAVALALRLALPGSNAGAWGPVLLLAPLLAVLAVAIELTRLPPTNWGDAWLGSTAAECLASIPLLAIPLLAAILLAIRRGAPLSPALAGTMCGLAAGAIAASLYALHCDEDSPLFYATWYSLAIMIVGGVGALLGPRLLRW